MVLMAQKLLRCNVVKKAGLGPYSLTNFKANHAMGRFPKELGAQVICNADIELTMVGLAEGTSGFPKLWRVGVKGISGADV